MQLATRAKLACPAVVLVSLSATDRRRFHILTCLQERWPGSALRASTTAPRRYTVQGDMWRWRDGAWLKLQASPIAHPVAVRGGLGVLEWLADPSEEWDARSSGVHHGSAFLPSVLRAGSRWS